MYFEILTWESMGKLQTLQYLDNVKNNADEKLGQYSNLVLRTADVGFFLYLTL